MAVCGVDCEIGRSLGCKTYCCRLLVRLTVEEMQPSENGQAAKGFVDKDEDGYCIHFDRTKYLCAVWEKRPEICGAYNCNHDILLQVAIKRPFNSIVDLVNQVETLNLKKEEYVQVPYVDEQSN